MPTNLTLRRGGRGYVLAGGDEPTASLDTSFGMRHGKIHYQGTVLPITVTNFWRTGVQVGSDSAPVVRLDGDHCVLPGGGQTSWAIGRTFRGYHATVSRGDDRIELTLPKLHGNAVRATVTGTWPLIEVVVLAACFAMISCRRGRTFRTLAVVGATGHGR